MVSWCEGKRVLSALQNASDRPADHRCVQRADTRYFVHLGIEEPAADMASFATHVEKRKGQSASPGGPCPQ